MGEAIRTQIDVEVRYFETDQMGLVHHANYLVWFELARTDLCARSGYHYADIERIGYRLLNIELQVRYRKPAHYGETVSVTCWIEDLASRAIRFAYEVRRDDELLVTGSTQHLWVEATSNHPCRTPEELRQPFRKLAGHLRLKVLLRAISHSLVVHIGRYGMSN